MNKLLINSSYITIQITDNDRDALEKVNHIPYIHCNRSRTKFTTSIRNIELVMKLFRNIDISNLSNPDLKVPENIKKYYLDEVKRKLLTEELLKTGPKHKHAWLYNHQELGRELAQINDRYCFFFDTRTGKTPMSLQIIQDDLKVNPGHKWLILCPLILIDNAWLPDSQQFFPEIKVQRLHHSVKAKRLEMFKKNASVYVANIESFAAYYEEFEKLNIYGCIVDESSTMKSHKRNAKFAKAAVRFAQTMKRWYLLSGSPAPNGEYEYYTQLQSIDFYGVPQSFAKFRNLFFDNISRSELYEKLVPKQDIQGELTALIKKYSIYVDKEDVLTLAGREFVEIPITMPEELVKYYNKMKYNLYLETDSTTILAANAAAKVNKLNQVSSGFIIDTEQESSYLLSDYRFEALYSLLDTLRGQQVIIWANYRLEFELIKKKLGNLCGCVYGGIHLRDKNENIQNFKDGKLQYLLCHPKSADKGLTLTNCNICIYFSLNYSYEAWKQSTERIYGDISKQANKCYYYILLAENSIDKIIYEVLQNKGDISLALLEHLKGGLN